MLSAQDAMLVDSSEVVLIKASRISTDAIDREIKEPNTSLVDALRSASPIQLQSNGPGYLSTALVHGFGARHTAIVWNEFNIQSPINGTYDLSLINGFNKIKYSTNSLSTSLGTSSLAGAIVLDHEDLGNSTSIELTTTDTKNIRANLKHNFDIGKLSSQVGIHMLRHKNQFDYKFNGSTDQWGSRLEGQDLHWQSRYAATKKFSIAGSLWLQRYSRDVPGSLVTNSDPANQEDNNYRYQLGALYLDKEFSAKLSYAHFSEGLNFETIGVDSRALNHVNAINLSAGTSTHKLNISHRIDNTDANFFNENIDRTQSQFSYENRRKWNNQLASIVSISKQVIDDQWSPWLFDLGLKYKTDAFVLGMSFNRSYNTPALNDRFWPTGGNPDLVPEEAYGLDIDVEFKISSSIDLVFSPYYKLVSNWILWTPGEQFWSPKNQREVLSRGFDKAIQVRLTDKLNSSFSFSFTKATVNEENNFPNLIGKQMIYVPKVKSNWSLEYELGGFKLRPEILYISKRYVTTDNTTSLPGYGLVDLSIQKDLKLSQNNNITVAVTAHNLLNEDYQQIRFYPMPLGYFELNLIFKNI